MLVVASRDVEFGTLRFSDRTVRFGICLLIIKICSDVCFMIVIGERKGFMDTERR